MTVYFNEAFLAAVLFRCGFSLTLLSSNIKSFGTFILKVTITSIQENTNADQRSGTQFSFDRDCNIKQTRNR